MLVLPGRIVSSCPLVSTVAAGVHMGRTPLLPNNGFLDCPRNLGMLSQCNDQRHYENLLVSTHRSRSSDQSHGEVAKPPELAPVPYIHTTPTTPGPWRMTALLSR